MLVPYVIGPVLCYLVGSVPAAYILVKLLKGIDIRTLGSGNVGATNAARAFDPKYRYWVFAGVLAMDLLKGVASVAVIFSLRQHFLQQGEHDYILWVLYGLLAVVGHMWPIYLSFKGGKGVATTVGVLLVVAPNAVLVAAIVWLVTLASTKYMSVASILGTSSLAISFVLNHEQPFGKFLPITVFCVLVTVMIVVRHWANVRRLVEGTESRINDPH